MRKSKIIGVLLIAVMVLAAPGGETFAAGGDITIVVDGKILPQDAEQGFAYIKNGRTMVPLRLISENFDMQVDWYKETQIILLNDCKGSGHEYSFKIGQKYFEKAFGGDAIFIDMDVAPEISNGRTYIPLRAGEAIFGKMSWLNDERIVYIQTNDTAMSAEAYKANFLAAINSFNEPATEKLFMLGEGSWDDYTEKVLSREHIKTYYNTRYGFKMPYPQSWGEPRESDNGDGAVLLDKNGYRLLIFGTQRLDLMTAQEMTMEQYMKEYYPVEQYFSFPLEIGGKYPTGIYSFSDKLNTVQGYVFPWNEDEAITIRYEPNVTTTDFQFVDKQPTFADHYHLYRILTEKFLQMNF